MLENAVSRTPVETWMQILQYAIWSPLDGMYSDDILQSTEILRLKFCSEGPHPLHRQIEQIRTNLRLVSRSWNSTIGMNASVSIVSIRTDLNRWDVVEPKLALWPSQQIYESASWIQLIHSCRPLTDYDRMYGRNCKSPWCRRRSEHPDSRGNIICPATAEIILCPFIAEDSIQRFLETCPRTLWALRWAPLPSSTSFITVLQRFQQLTHLYLDCDGFHFSDSLSLPQVHVLCLYDLNSDAVQESPDWHLPNLRHLCLNLNSWQSISSTDIHILSSSRNSVTSLFIDYQYRSTPSINSNIWGYFPHLSNLCLPLELVELFNLKPRAILRPNDKIPFRLTITGFIAKLDSYPSNNGDIIARRIVELVQSPFWHGDTVLFDALWSQLSDLLRRNSLVDVPPLRSPRTLAYVFRYLRDKQVEIHDQSGAGYQDLEGSAFFHELDA